MCGKVWKFISGDWEGKHRLLRWERLVHQQRVLPFHPTPYLITNLRVPHEASVFGLWWDPVQHMARHMVCTVSGQH